MSIHVDSTRPGRNEVQQFTRGAFHRWYNFVLGFPDHLVGQLLKDFSVSSGAIIFDPFCGTGTTLIESSKHQLASVGIDANPFATFAAKVKSSFALDPDALERAAVRIEERYRTILSSKKRFTSEVTYLYLNESGMIERGWISPKPLHKALALREAIRRGRRPELRSASMLALVSDLPQKIGNMKFGPQIYCGPAKTDVDPIPLFRDRVSAMAQDLRTTKDREQFPKPVVLLGDARGCEIAFKSHFQEPPKIDFVICSPPYPTEHDYTRHTRLELAFTEDVSTKACVRRIKRSMIRSHTKGIYKDDSDMEMAEDIVGIEALAKLVETAILGKESGFEKLYPTVVRSYFGGMKRHFQSLFGLMRSGGKAAYVVGDQAAYLRVPIRTAMLLGEVAETVGFKIIEIKLWRRRWATGISEYLDENILILAKP